MYSMWPSARTALMLTKLAAALSQVEDAQKKAAADKEQRETARSAETSFLADVCTVHVACRTC